MSVRTRMLRKWRKNILRLGKDNVRIEILNKRDDGTIDPDRSQWGYLVAFKANGHHCDCFGNNFYEAFQGADYCRRWVESREPFVPPEN